MPDELEVPAPLKKPGTIARRQTTFWEVLPEGGRPWRVHFSRKEETFFRQAAYNECVLLDDHPLLDHHCEPWFDVHVSSRSEGHAGFFSELGTRIDDASYGWRSIEDYLNNHHAEQILVSGYGILLEGPESIARETSGLLTEFGVRHKLFRNRRSKLPVRALVLTSGNAVVAGEFRFQEVSPSSGGSC